MPRPRKTSALDEQIISLATQFGQAVARAVRESIGAEVGRVIAGRPERAASASAAAGPRRRKRADGPAVQKKIIDILGRAKKGLQTGQLVDRTGMHRGAVEYHLRLLRKQRKTRVVGTRGQARWLAQ
jgi:Bacterial regulatory protein, arsR family